MNNALIGVSTASKRHWDISYSSDQIVARMHGFSPHPLMTVTLGRRGDMRVEQIRVWGAYDRLDLSSVAHDLAELAAALLAQSRISQ